MKWSEQVWSRIEKDYQSILKMPFITELADGSLPKNKFQFYMAQDSIYLEHFGRALALVGARAHDIKDALSFMGFAANAIVVENALHESYFVDFGVTDKGKIEPACHHYVHFLKSTTALDAVEVGMAAVLPCFWIYQRVGDHIYKNSKAENNPYQKWINTYSGEEFGVAVQQAIMSCDEVAAKTTSVIRDKMTEAFVASTLLEYNFWQAAYDLKMWR
ncbi:thiaminase II [Gynurincola endophyticus]|jgi:thiaminase/transcriptional activator TenA|uniref:thiaminase II n=1 Tax=Gynurincola endophyticus TaxID=2479004 RepID=UPI000F8CB2CD|nr:thiaminase II [Gynurincola endophyticus]